MRPSREVVARRPAQPPGGRRGRSPASTTDPELRVRQARGQSFPDLIALRSGRLDAVPDAVARPADRRRRPRASSTPRRDRGARLIPYGGGTSVVGGVSARPARTR